MNYKKYEIETNVSRLFNIKTKQAFDTVINIVQQKL